MKPSVSILLLGLALPDYSLAAIHPVLRDPRIDSCQASVTQGSCAAMVQYRASGTDFVEVPESGPPNAAGGLNLSAIGLHCEFGNNLAGRRFSSCSFTGSPDHHPILNPGCRLKSTSSWELEDRSRCDYTTSTWGVHQGAGPGGECILVVQTTGGWGPSYATTIHGQLSPDAVANSGNAFCQKPLPPDVTCDINIPPTLDHGEITPNSHSVQSVNGSVDCGSRPKLTVVGGGKLRLGPGLSTVLTAQMDGTTRVRLTSTLDAINAESGAYRGAAVVLVSPY